LRAKRWLRRCENHIKRNAIAYVTAAAPPFRFVVGIDPGLSGAVALVSPTREVEVLDMPTLRIEVGKKERRVLDLYALARYFDINRIRISHATIEEPGAMPHDGPVQAFSFGFSCGATQACVAAAGIPMNLVRPAAWKAAMGLTGGKDASRRRASQVLPEYAHLWSRVKDDGRAEAVLLALYGART
jgi:crossover junction endodeoxyribonuclease RuvC